MNGPPDAVASPWRRVAAWMLDYLLIAVYLILLTTASVGLIASPGGSSFASAMRPPIPAELIGILTLTGPVVVYFALMEASPWQATLGKRALGILVVGPGGMRLTVGRAFAREGVRLLPWGLSHALIWQAVLSPQRNAMTALETGGFAVVYCSFSPTWSASSWARSIEPSMTESQAPG